MIKAIVFDYGNVISMPQDTGCYARMAALTGLTPEFFTQSFWKYRPPYDRGSIRGIALYRDVLAEAGIKGTERELDELAARLLAEDIGSWAHVSREVTEWGLTLRKAGYKLGILSNMPWDFLERYGHTVELFERADVAVFSCEVSLIKPEPAIYRELIARLACKPDEIVFFDDIRENVDGALAEGIRAFQWTGLGQGKRDWESVTEK